MGTYTPSIGLMTHPLTQGDNGSLDPNTYGHSGTGPHLGATGSCFLMPNLDLECVFFGYAQ